MRGAQLCNIVLVGSMIYMTLFLIFMWKYERTIGSKIWGIGIVVCCLGIFIGFKANEYQNIISILGSLIYYLGEATIIYASIQLLADGKCEKNIIYKLKQCFFITLLVIVSIICVINNSVYEKGIYFAVFLAIWHGFSVFVFIKKFVLEMENKILVIISSALRIMLLILFNTYTSRDYYYLIFGFFYAITCILLAVSTSLVYFQGARKTAGECLKFVDEIMANSSIVLNRLDFDGNILYSNKGLKIILDNEEEWQNIRQLEKYMDAKERIKMNQILACLKPERMGGKFQIQIKNKNNHYIWVSMDINPVMENGVKTGNVLSCSDMTAEKIIYTDLMKNQRKFYQVFQGIQDAIFIVPFSEDYVHSTFKQFNKAACENFGYREYECKGMSIADLDIRFLDNRDTKQGISCGELMQTLFKEEKVIYETEFLTKSGKYIPVEVVDYKFKLDNEDMIMSVVRDISERNLIKESKRLERAKSDFLANVSHELRTPLNVIIVTLQSLEVYVKDVLAGKEVRDYTRGTRYTEIMKQNALRLLKLVNNFVCMAKIDSGFYNINKKNYNIVSLVEDVSHSVVPYIEGNCITFEFDTDVEEKVVACDVDMIEKIILNLISNAVKFTKSGGLLLIDIKDKGNEVEITVTDSGIGIPKDKQKVIFERFRQADKTFTRTQEGCGIGLYLVKHFIKQHDGSVDIESVEGIGSRFRVTLPAFEELDVPYIEYSFDEESDTLYKRALEFSDIIH